MMENCPHCHRRLISHISVRCNWCGEVIEDAQYQTQAAVKRDMLKAEELLHEAQRLQNTSNAGYGTLGDPFFGDPLLGIPIAIDAMARSRAAADAARRAELQARAILTSQQTPPSPPVDEAAPTDRFGKLELE